MLSTKPFNISKTLVMEAFKDVKANAGSAGVDKEQTEADTQTLSPIKSIFSLKRFI
jgi:hypothetical protein